MGANPQALIMRRMRQFTRRLKAMWGRAHQGVGQRLHLILSTHRHPRASFEACAEKLAKVHLDGESEKGINQQWIEEFNLAWGGIANKADKWIWKRLVARMRYVQFDFDNNPWFSMCIPKASLSEADSQRILRERKDYFYLRHLFKSKSAKKQLKHWDPLSKYYKCGELHIATQDLAYLLFKVWRFDANWRFYLTVIDADGTVQDRERSMA